MKREIFKQRAYAAPGMQQSLFMYFEILYQLVTLSRRFMESTYAGLLAMRQQLLNSARAAIVRIE